jgi:microcystin-dependent protein
MTLYYIIKATGDVAPAAGKIPAGAMAGFAGESVNPPAEWLHCDGQSYAVSRFQDLHAAISYNYGGDGVSTFNVPDLRGRFIRATSHGAGHDPDAAERPASSTGGSEGDSTGSAQGFATARPSKLGLKEAGAHDHTIARVPHQYHNVAYGASGPAAKDCLWWTDDTTESGTSGEHLHTVVGGDKETRPTNVYVEWLIASDDINDAPPIGSVLPVGADMTNISELTRILERGWLPCDGGALNVSDSKYRALYDVIGTTYGGDRQQFLVPDLRGFFVQGAGKEKVGVITNESRSGAPSASMTTTSDGDHAHTFPFVPTESHVIDVVMGATLAEDNPSETRTSIAGEHTHTVSGGDKESRPVNVYVDYIIRYR